MAVEWSSRESMLRGVSKFHTVDLNDELTKTYIEGTLILEKHTLRKNLDLSFFFYLEKEDLNATIYEGHLASLKGTRLGVFDNLRLVLEGHGTDFPLTEYHQVKEPLWKIMSTWNDPFTDSFSDNISIFINRAHNNYKFLDPDDTKNFNKILMDEIILSAMNVIIWKVISFETWQFKDDYVISQDSVAAAVLHFIDTFNLSIDSEESLSNSLRAIKMELSEEL